MRLVPVVGSTQGDSEAHLLTVKKARRHGMHLLAASFANMV